MLSYVEMHYKPPFMHSFLYRACPEIVFDAPARIEPGKELVIFLFIKDAHLFPIVLESVEIKMIREGGGIVLHTFDLQEKSLLDPFWWKCFKVVSDQEGVIFIEPTLKFKLNGKSLSVITDNYRGTSHKPLKINISPHKLPSAENWYSGDIHCHSIYTSDVIEFGPPVEALAISAESMGLDWIAVADHSYDLGDSSEVPDSENRFQQLRQECHSISDKFIVFPGEEISCTTSKGRNCHMLALDHSIFIKGSGDKGNLRFMSKSEHTISEAAGLCNKDGGFACAAHPYEEVSFGEKLFLNRGKWERKDFTDSGIKGIQFFNGSRDKGFDKGKLEWISMLLSGKRIAPYGGSDSHGDMNRRRAVEIPLLFLKENDDKTLGKIRTLVYSLSLDRDELFKNLKKGRAVITDGPFIEIKSGALMPGDTVKRGEVELILRFLSTPEFGNLQMCRIIYGKTGSKEITIAEMDDGKYEEVWKSRVVLNEPGYIRAECETVNKNVCLTNPLWVS